MRVMRHKKLAICISLCLIVAVTSGIVFASAGANEPKDTSTKTQNVNTSDGNTEAVNTSEQNTSETITLPETVKPAETVQPTTAPEPTGTTADSPTKGEAGGHIPFTNQPVTAGDPQSYVGTVGQCPFYEMAGDKGCYPPADIKCNADWSMCDPVVDQKGEAK